MTRPVQFVRRLGQAEEVPTSLRAARHRGSWPPGCILGTGTEALAARASQHRLGVRWHGGPYGLGKRAHTTDLRDGTL